MVHKIRVTTKHNHFPFRCEPLPELLGPKAFFFIICNLLSAEFSEELAELLDPLDADEADEDPDKPLELTGLIGGATDLLGI